MTKQEYDSLTPKEQIFAILLVEILKELKGINRSVETELEKV